MKTIHHRYKLFSVLMVLMTIGIPVLYGYMYYMVGVSTDHAVTALDLVRVEALNKNNQQELIDTYEKSSADRLKLEKYFIPNDTIVIFIETLERLGTRANSNLTLSSVTVDTIDTTIPGTIGKAHAHVSVEGSWSAVMRTLLLAELIPYKSSIQNIQLDTQTSLVPGSKVEKNEWRMSFDINVATMVPSIKK